MGLPQALANPLESFDERALGVRVEVSIEQLPHRHNQLVDEFLPPKLGEAACERLEPTTPRGELLICARPLRGTQAPLLLFSCHAACACNPRTIPRP